MASDESAGGSASPESESHAHTRVRVDHWLMSGFLPVGRSGPGALGGGVVGWRWSSRWKSLSEKFNGSRGSLMAAEDSRDGGELAGVQYGH